MGRGILIGVPRFVWGSAWTLLVLTNLFWSLNIVIGRGVAGTVPPVALAWWRWTGAFAVALCFAWPRLRRDLPVMLRSWPMMLVLGATGIACYNTMAYIALNLTTALNVLLLQSAQPLFIVLWVFVLFREHVSARQWAGIGLSMAGVAAIAARGSLETLLQFRLNAGDLWVIAAMAIYGIYTALLRRRPAVHPLSFLTAAMGIGSVMILPFMLWEAAEGARITGGWPSFAAIAYTAVFPSLLAYLCFNRGVELIGAPLAGQSVHLLPMMGSVLAVVFLGEAFELFHAAGIVLIMGGITLASWRGRR